MQLEDASPHQRERGECVGAVTSAIHEENGQTFPGEQHRRSGAGTPRPHHDGVIALARDGCRCLHARAFRTN
jgi:hypothetical protein